MYVIGDAKACGAAVRGTDPWHLPTPAVSAGEGGGSEPQHGSHPAAHLGHRRCS